MRSWAIGIDLGQKTDHSAMVVLELGEKFAVCRIIHKFELGTPIIPTVLDFVEAVVKRILDFGDSQITYFTIDATGMGQTPSQMFDERLSKYGLSVYPFVFTLKLKKELIGNLKMLYATRRLRFAAANLSENPIFARMIHEMIEEMKNYEVKMRPNATEDEEMDLGVFRTGEHDDMVTALALAAKDIGSMYEYGGGNVNIGFLTPAHIDPDPLGDEAIGYGWHFGGAKPDSPFNV